MRFSEYLERHQYAPSSISRYGYVAERFLLWCRQKGLDPTTVDYGVCKEYIQHLKNRKGKHGPSLSDKTVYHHIGVLKLYFRYLIFEDECLSSPLDDINLKGIERDYKHDLLSSVELEELYLAFQTIGLKPPNCTSVAVRNKVLIGLAVFQGLDAKALGTLGVDNINLKSKKIHIPGTRRTESRTLRLRNCQMELLRRYLEEDRHILQKRIDSGSGALFPVRDGRIGIITQTIVRKLKPINYRVTGLKQIRASVITNWVMKNDLRQAQYKAGHRYISSTERYKRNDLDTMHRGILRYHPLS